MKLRDFVRGKSRIAFEDFRTSQDVRSQEFYVAMRELGFRLDKEFGYYRVYDFDKSIEGKRLKKTSERRRKSFKFERVGKREWRRV